MDDKTIKIILITVAVLVLVTCLGGGALIGLAMVFRGARLSEVTPAPSVTPGVKEGSGYLKKRLVTEAQGFAPLMGLYTVDQGRDGIQELVVVGESSAAIFDQQWRGLKAVTLDGVEPWITTVPFDAQGDGVIEFLCQSGEEGDPLFLNSEGKRVEFAVKHSEGTGAEVADVDGDGRAEILAGDFLSGDLRLLDLSGRELWSRESTELSAFDFIDLPGGGRAVVILANEKECAIHEAGSGRAMVRCENGEYRSDLRPVRWIGDTGRSHFILTGDDFGVYDSGGKLTARIASFDPDDFAVCAYGASVKLGPAEPELFAMAQVFEGIDVLCLTDGTGKRVYAEVLESVPMDVVGIGEHLYVALDSGVWDYTLASGGTAVMAEEPAAEATPEASGK